VRPLQGPAFISYAVFPNFTLSRPYDSTDPLCAPAHTSATRFDQSWAGRREHLPVRGSRARSTRKKVRLAGTSRGAGCCGETVSSDWPKCAARGRLLYRGTRWARLLARTFGGRRAGRWGCRQRREDRNLQTTAPGLSGATPHPTLPHKGGGVHIPSRCGEGKAKRFGRVSGGPGAPPSSDRGSPISGIFRFVGVDFVLLGKNSASGTSGGAGSCGKSASVSRELLRNRYSSPCLRGKGSPIIPWRGAPNRGGW
jgi:hypothetical protein